MAESSEMIDIIVSDGALTSLDTLEKKLAASYLQMEELLKEATKLNTELSKSGQSFSELSKNIEQVVQVEQKSTQVIQNQNNLIQQKTDLTNKIISAVKNLSATESDFYEAEGHAGETVKKINALLSQTNGLREENAKRLVENQKELSKLHDRMKMLEKQLESGAVTSDAYIEKRAQMIMKEQELKQEISGLQTTMKNQVKIDQSRTDTMEQESLVLGNLRMAWRALTDEQKNTAAGKQMLATINELDQKLKENDATIGNHQRKVGNYEIAAKTLRKELWSVKQSLFDMALSGEKSSEAYQKMENKAVSLQMAIRDTNKEVLNLVTHGTSMKAVTEGVSLVVSSYNAYKSAMVALGVENENLEKTMQRVMAAMAALQAIEQINNVLLKKSAFNTKVIGGLKKWWAGILRQATAEQVINNTATAAGTAAQGANAAATTAQAGATVTATVANKGFAASFRMISVAIKSIPVFGWVITAVSGLVAVFASLNRKTKEEREEMEKLREESQKLNKYIEENVIALGDEMAILNKLQKQWNDLANDLKGKEKFITDNKEEFDKLGVSVNNVYDAEKVLVSNTEDVIKAMKLRAIATAAQKLAAEKYEKYLKAQMDADKVQVDTTPYFGMDEGEAKAKEMAKNINQGLKDMFQEGAGTIKKEADDLMSFVVKNLEEGNTILEQIGLTERKNTTDRSKDRAKLTSDQILVIQGMKEEADNLKVLSEDTSKSFAERREAAGNHASALENISYMTAKYEIENQKLAGKNAEVVWGDSAEEIRKIRAILNKDLISLDKEREKSEKEALQKWVGDEKEAMNERLNNIRESMNNELILKSQEYEKDMLANVGNESKRKQITRDYNLQRLNIIRQSNQTAFEEETEVLKMLLENTELSEKEKSNIIKRLDTLSLKNSQDIANTEIQITKNKVASQLSLEEELQNILNDKRTKAVMQMWSTALEMANMYYDNELQRIDELEAREKEYYDNELNALQNNLDKGTVSEEYANQRKIELEAEWSAKEKQFEDQRKEMQKKQANWQKAEAIVQATINTAQAITAAYSVPYVGIALAAIIGALGAAQISMIASQQIPEYEEGTKNHPGGLAIVGDGGKAEMAILPSGEIWKTPARETLVNLPRGTEILPDFKKTIENIAAYPYIPLKMDEGRGETVFMHDDVLRKNTRQSLDEMRKMNTGIQVLRKNMMYSEKKAQLYNFTSKWK